MKRRGFLQALGLGVLSTPAVLAEVNETVKSDKMLAHRTSVTDRQLRKLIEEGVERNLMVFDCDGNGDFTQRLVYLMLNVADEDIDHMFIPRDCYPNFDHVRGIYGVTFSVVKELNEDGKLTTYFKDTLNGSFPVGKGSLVLAIGKKTILLGAA